MRAAIRRESAGDAESVSSRRARNMLPIFVSATQGSNAWPPSPEADASRFFLSGKGWRVLYGYQNRNGRMRCTRCAPRMYSVFAPKCPTRTLWRRVVFDAQLHCRLPLPPPRAFGQASGRSRWCSQLSNCLLLGARLGTSLRLIPANTNHTASARHAAIPGITITRSINACQHTDCT